MTRRRTKKETPPSPSFPSRWKQELSAIGLFLLALFIWTSTRSPHATGFVGYWIVSQFLGTLFGGSLFYLPTFLIVGSLIQFFSASRWRLTLSVLGFSFILFTITYDMTVFRVVPIFEWPIPLNGGGWIGHTGVYLLQGIFGAKGTHLFLAGSFLVSFIILFKFSFLEASKRAGRFLNIVLRPLTPLTSKDAPLSLRLSHFLFFKRVTTTDIVPHRELNLSHKPSKNKKKHIPFLDEDVITIDPVEDAFPLLNQDPTPITETPTTQFEFIDETPFLAPEAESVSPKSSSKSFKLPPLSLLEKSPTSQLNSEEAVQQRSEMAHVLEEALFSYKVDAKVVHITPGPSVTRYELKPGSGVKISKITALSKDIALKLAAQDVRIEAPIPGKSLVGIEVPNKTTQMITLRNLLTRADFYDSPSNLLTAIGVTITGESIYMDLAKLPHILIAGATGSGKSVCINTIIMSILMKSTPKEVKFLMIDPKKVELSLYEGIPHLVAPVVTNPQLAAATLKQWALTEMEKRYERFSILGVKDIKGYNKQVETLKKELYNAKEFEKTRDLMYRAFPEADGIDEPSGLEVFLDSLPYLVVIIDELADLMMVASQDVENTICRLAQMARATGIHLVIATQRPSVNVVTGLIKANVPSRISFFLQSQIDSRTILDASGAEKLLGKGDMLFMPVGAFHPQRIQGVYVGEKEIKDVVKFWKKQGNPDYELVIEDLAPLGSDESTTTSSGDDDLFNQAKEIVQSTKYASTSYLQRKLRIGYNRAARLMDELEEKNIISSYQGEKKAREVL